MSFGDEMMRALDTVAALTRDTGFRSSPTSVRGVKARLGYILSPKTGTSVEAVAEATGVTARTVRRWQKGGTPSKASKQKIDEVYQRYFGIKVHARRQKARARVLGQVRRDALHLENLAGSERFWKPARRWPDFVDAWADGGGELDGIWDDIVADWDGSDWGAWLSDQITDVTIE